jgi:SIR2-like domain
MNFRANEIIFLLGAGASIEAEIPGSIEMIRDIENFIKTKNDWEEFSKLYNYIKSSIYHGEGINGRFDREVNYNIEKLANTLSEIDKKEEHIIYPFVASWDKRLSELAGHDFGNISKFKQKILVQLQTWICRDEYNKASYYKKMMEFRDDYQFPLRIFTLNYDLCIEETCTHSKIETGFDDRSILDLSRFNTDEGEQGNIDIFLYKLHGSINWYEESGDVKCTRSPRGISHDKMEIIFGTTQKFRYKEPYLTALTSFKVFTSTSKLIVVIGYSFADEHINYILKNTLSLNSDTKILVVSYINFQTETEKLEIIQKKVIEICSAISIADNGQVVVAPAVGAKDFMNNHMNVDYFKSLFTQEPNPL